MLHIQIPEFKNDFFRKTPNPALSSIEYDRCEIGEIISYFDYHTKTHPVSLSIIQLLDSLKKYTCCFGSLMNNIADQTYQRLETGFQSTLKKTQEEISSNKYADDTALLSDALDYSQKLARLSVKEAIKTNPETLEKWMKHSSFLRESLSEIGLQHKK